MPSVVVRCRPTYAGRRRTSSSSPALVVPATRRSSLGYRAFLVTAARAWNTLRSTVTAASTLHLFRWALKLIYSPHLSHHHIVTLSAFWANVRCFDYVRWPCSLLTLYVTLICSLLHYIIYVVTMFLSCIVSEIFNVRSLVLSQY